MKRPLNDGRRLEDTADGYVDRRTWLRTRFVHPDVITDHVQSTREGNVFTRDCGSVPGKGRVSKPLPRPRTVDPFTFL